MAHASKFFWYELLAADDAAAAKFYGDVVGWDARDSGMTDKTGVKYTLLFVNETNAAGGLMKLPEDAKAMGARPSWVGYVLSENVDADADRVKQLGGKVLRPPGDIPGVGRFAVVADPQGAAFCVMKPFTEGPPPAYPAPDTPGLIGWRELHTTDWKAGSDFYGKLFGWTKGEGMDMGPMGTYQIFNIDGEMAGGMMNNPNAPHPSWLYYFNVAGIDAAQQRVEKGGGKVLMGPQEVPGGSFILQCLDPQNVAFALVGPRG
jgi:uncharacterized protein